MTQEKGNDRPSEEKKPLEKVVIYLPLKESEKLDPKEANPFGAL
jgi:hypothetical protein